MCPIWTSTTSLKSLEMETRGRSIANIGLPRSRLAQRSVPSVQDVDARKTASQANIFLSTLELICEIEVSIVLYNNL